MMKNASNANGEGWITKEKKKKKKKQGGSKRANKPEITIVEKIFPGVPAKKPEPTKKAETPIVKEKIVKNVRSEKEKNPAGQGQGQGQWIKKEKRKKNNNKDKRESAQKPQVQIVAHIIPKVHKARPENRDLHVYAPKVEAPVFSVRRVPTEEERKQENVTVQEARPPSLELNETKENVYPFGCAKWKPVFMFVERTNLSLYEREQEIRNVGMNDSLVRRKRGLKGSWIEWLQIPMEMQDARTGPPLASWEKIEKRHDVVITLTQKFQNFLAVEGSQQSVGKACQDIINLTEVRSPIDNGDELFLKEEKLADAGRLPDRIWLAGWMLRRILFQCDCREDVLILESLKRSLDVDIREPRGSQKYRMMEILGKGSDAETALKRIEDILAHRRELDDATFARQERRQERRDATDWLEWLEVPLQLQQTVEDRQEYFEEKYNIEVTFISDRPSDHIYIRGARLQVTAACKEIIRLVKLSDATDNGADMMKAEKKESSHCRLPQRIWPAGFAMESIRVEEDKKGMVIGRNGRMLRDLRRRFKVDICLPGREEEYSCLDVLGRQADVKAAIDRIGRMVSEEKEGQRNW